MEETTYSSALKLPTRSWRERAKSTFSWLKSSKTTEAKVLSVWLRSHTRTRMASELQAPPFTPTGVSSSNPFGRKLDGRVHEKTQARARTQVKAPKQHEASRNEVWFLMTSARDRGAATGNSPLVTFSHRLEDGSETNTPHIRYDHIWPLALFLSLVMFLFLLF